MNFRSFFTISGNDFSFKTESNRWVHPVQCTHASTGGQIGGPEVNGDPTRQTHTLGEGLTGRDLAVGEVTGGEVLTLTLYSTRRT
jgi:hypothetical protein